MSSGLNILLGLLSGFVVITIFQAVMSRRSRAREGTPIGPLPTDFAHLAHADTLVWFHSPTCGPCRAMHRDVATLSSQGKLVEVDVSQHLDVARVFSVMVTPTTVHVRDGHIVAVRTGVLREDALGALAAR